jgi:hypothetical protein
VLKRASIHKRGNAVNPGPEAAFCQAGGHAHHVLLRDTGIDKAVPHGVSKRFKRHKTEITS